MKQCILDDTKICTDCSDCDRCDIDPNKICDNCCNCLDTDEQFVSVRVSDVVTDEESEHLLDYYSDEDDTNGLDEYSAFEQPDPELLAEWDAKLRAIDEHCRQPLPKIHGSRRRIKPETE